jgi:hypothetical protein
VSASPTVHDARWLYRAGGICALLIGIGYVITIPLYTSAGAPPEGGEAVLKYLVGKTATWWVIVGLSVVTDLLYVPAGLALYFALKDFNQNLMLIAVAFIALFVVLNLGVTWTNYASLISLSGGYGAASTDAQKQAYVAAANYAKGVLDSHLEVVYAIGLLSFAILLIGIVMVQTSVFTRIAAYLALATGLLGIAAVGGVGVAIIVNALAATVWVLVVGYRLYRLGGRSP